MELFYKTTYRMRTNDFDCYDKLTPTSILDSFQDIAGTHAELIGMGFSDMVKKGYYWVVVREKITIFKSPKPGESVVVSTWPEPKGRLEFVRNYKMEDENGNIIAIGSSVWVLISTTTRRLSRAEEINYVGEFVQDKNYDKLNKLPKYEELEKNYIHQVGYTDLDHNKHMNNSKYVDVMMNSCQFNSNVVIKELQIDFINEARYLDNLNFKYKQVDNVYYFEAYNDDKLCIRAEMRIENE